MLPYRDSKFTTVALVVFFILALAYTLFEARGIILGPTITVSGEISEVHEQFVMIKGQADRIFSLSMNGKQIQVTKEGAFAESHILAIGYNRVVLEAKDQYGRSTERALEIIYTPPSTDSPPAGGSPQTGSQPSQDATAGTAGQAPSTDSTVSASSTVPLAQ
ncbi:MAG TPA: hypothetical protein VJG64_04390 [Candidatus Paceibacterota bacterium]